MAGSAEPVVVTGYGVFAPATIDEGLQLVTRGETKVAEHELPDSGGVGRIGALAPTFAPFGYLPQRKWLKYMGPATQLAVWAAGDALKDAALMAPEAAATRRSMALLLATGPIAFELAEVVPALRKARRDDGAPDWEALGTAGLRAVSPMMPFHTLLNMPIGLVSMCFGLEGHNAIYYPDIEQTAFAFAAAVRGIQNRRFEAALVGGTAQLMSLMPLAGLTRDGSIAATPGAARPFSALHQGWAPGNGAAMVVLESASHARSRGARIYGALRLSPPWEGCPRSTRDYDLTIATGTRSSAQDEAVSRATAGHPVLSFDGAIGFLGPAALPWSLAAACCLLERPHLFGGGAWCREGSVRVVAALGGLSHPQGPCIADGRDPAKDGATARWAELELERIS